MIPWVLWSFFLTPHSLAGADWISDLWRKIPPVLAIPKSLEVFGLGSQARFLPLVLKQFTMHFPLPLRLLGLAAMIGLGVVAAAPWGDTSIGLPWMARRKAALWILLLGPLLAMWTISLLVTPVYIAGRYDLVSFPAFPLLAGLALAKISRLERGTLLAPLAAAALLVPVGVKLVQYYEVPPKDNFRLTARILDATVHNGDAVVFTDLRGLPVIYQLGRLGYRWEDEHCTNPASGRRFTCRMYPRETESAPAVFDPSRVLAAPETVRIDVDDLLLGLPSERGTVHVVLGKFATAPGRLAVQRVDNLLLRELERRGFRVVDTDPVQGIMRYRR